MKFCLTGSLLAVHEDSGQKNLLRNFPASTKVWTKALAGVDQATFFLSFLVS